MANADPVWLNLNRDQPLIQSLRFLGNIDARIGDSAKILGIHHDPRADILKSGSYIGDFRALARLVDTDPSLVPAHWLPYTDLRLLRRAWAAHGMSVPSCMEAGSPGAATLAGGAIGDGPYLLYEPVPGAVLGGRCAQHAEELSLAWRKLVPQETSATLLVERDSPQPEWLAIGISSAAGFRPVAVCLIERWAGQGFPCSLVCLPWTDPACDPIFEICSRAADAIPPPQGLFAYLLRGESGAFSIADFLPAPPMEDWPIELAALAGGADLIPLALQAAAGNAAEIAYPARAAAVRWLAARSGLVERIGGLDEVRSIDGVETVSISVRPGDVLRHITDRTSRDRIGFITAVGATREDAMARANRAAAVITVERGAAVSGSV